MISPKEYAENCRKAADFFEEKPGLAGAHSIIDIYRALAVLFEHIEAIKTGHSETEV